MLENARNFCQHLFQCSTADEQKEHAMYAAMSKNALSLFCQNSRAHICCLHLSVDMPRDILRGAACFTTSLGLCQTPPSTILLCGNKLFKEIPEDLWLINAALRDAPQVWREVSDFMHCVNVGRHMFSSCIISQKTSYAAASLKKKVCSSFLSRVIILMEQNGMLQGKKTTILDSKTAYAD